MRYMIIVKATKGSEAGQLPTAELLEHMGRFHKQLADAGVLIDAAGLGAALFESGRRGRRGADRSAPAL
ncbi:MAG TPA: hypothetical protein VGO61_11230 [Steroidobacteraceae bacterium]|jgi:hypothetical protein|nr:hypothetical protein [Steroidobacteraceae bacterium]